MKLNCKFCDREFTKNNLVRHEISCKENPLNKKICPICNKEFSNKSITCSYSCSNIYFRSGKNNGNWKDDSYRSTCFLYHKKECIICGEFNIVEVHHANENKNDNKPENLIPLCPTHHQYFHSRYRNKIESKINDFIDKFKLKLN